MKDGGVALLAAQAQHLAADLKKVLLHGVKSEKLFFSIDFQLFCHPSLTRAGLLLVVPKMINQKV